MRMTKEETQKVLLVIISAYPTFKPENVKATLNVWHEMLKEYSFEETMLGIKSLVATRTSEFAPSIGAVIESIANIKKPPLLNESEAWTLVSNALRDGYYHSQERFEELPPLVQRAVGSADALRNWAVSDERSIETVVASNFRKTYLSLVEQENKEYKLPTDVKALITQNKQIQIEQKGE